MEHQIWINDAYFTEKRDGSENSDLFDFPDFEKIRKNVTIILDKLAENSPLHPSYELSIFLVNDVEMRQINLEERQKDSTTDVLSFPSYNLHCEIAVNHHKIVMNAGEDDFIIPDELGCILGDVMISLDTCIRQAEEYQCTVAEEFYRLLIHGILHLFGYDHERSPQEENIMQTMEDELKTMIRI